MPIYEYQCRACGHELEAWQKISDHPLKKCPQCGKMQLHKLISAVGFRLKGGGWYETDFKSSGKKNVVETGEKKGDGAAAKAADKPKQQDKAKTESKQAATGKETAA